MRDLVPLFVLTALAACARGGVESDGKAQCAPPPIETPYPDQEQACRASGGFMTDYSSTCGDACETSEYPICGQALTRQCACPRDQCWSGWACVPDACSALYTPQALDALAEGTTQHARKRIEARLEQLRSVEPEHELAAARDFKAWLEAEHTNVTYNLRNPRGDWLDPSTFFEHVNDPLVVLFAVSLPRDIAYFQWTPKRPIAIKDEFEWVK